MDPEYHIPWDPHHPDEFIQRCIMAMEGRPSVEQAYLKWQIAHSQYVWNRFDEAQLWLDQAASAAGEPPSILWARIAKLRGDIFGSKHNNRQQLEEYELAAEYADASGETEVFVTALTWFAMMDDQDVDTMLLAISRAEGSTDLSVLMSLNILYQMLGEYYCDNREYQKSLDTFDLGMKLQDSLPVWLQSYEEAPQVSYVKQQMESEKKTRG